MIIRGANLISRLAVLLAVLFAVTACGGGGGGGGSDFYAGEDGGDTATLYFALFDPQGNATETVTSSAPGTFKVTISGKNTANVVVTAETSIGTILPTTGTALTNSSGVASFQIEAGAEKGAGTITVSATVNDIDVTGTFTFQVGDTGLRLGYFDDNGTFVENEIAIQPQETLAAGGNAQLTVVVLDKDGKRVTTAEEIRFNSGCIAAGLSTLIPENPIKASNGQASTTYTAAGCSGTDEITASLLGASAQAAGSISIAAPTANAVLFVSAEPTTLVLRGTGGANSAETSNVVFKVVDNTGAPLAGIPVALSLTTEIGGLSLSRTSGLSNGDGEVTVTVSSGDVATTVRVLATVNDGDGGTVATVSDLLSVTTGLPDMDSITVGVEGGFVVENGMTVNGVERTLTVSMSDQFNNPVIDGTTATWTTEYGTIDGSCQTGISNGARLGGTPVSGTCSVKWTSGAPREPGGSTGPVDTAILLDNVTTIFDGPNCPCPQDLGYTRGGRSTIVVRAQGEESFIDRNGNGILDQAEKDLFSNVPEAFIDNNEDGVYTVDLPSCLAAPLGSPQCIAGFEETFFDFNDNGVYDLNDDPAQYNGLHCPPEGDGVWCSRELVEVWADTVLTLSADPAWYFSVRGSGGTYLVYVADVYNNPPPAGSTVELKGADGCEVVSPSSVTVPNLSSTGAFGVDVITSGGGSVNVTLAPKDGTSITETLACTPLPPEPEACTEVPSENDTCIPIDCEVLPVNPACPVPAV